MGLGEFLENFCGEVILHTKQWEVVIFYSRSFISVCVSLTLARSEEEEEEEEEEEDRIVLETTRNSL